MSIGFLLHTQRCHSDADVKLIHMPAEDKFYIRAGGKLFWDRLVTQKCAVLLNYIYLVFDFTGTERYWSTERVASLTLFPQQLLYETTRTNNTCTLSFNTQASNSCQFRVFFLHIWAVPFPL